LKNVWKLVKRIVFIHDVKKTFVDD